MFCTTASWFTPASRFLLLWLLISFGPLSTRTQPPEALNYPNVVTFGSFLGAICYSNSVFVKSVTSITTRTLSFTPAANLQYVICYNNLALHPFDAQVVGGGIGTKLPTSIVLTSYTGKLSANCDAYCM